MSNNANTDFNDSATEEVKPVVAAKKRGRPRKDQGSFAKPPLQPEVPDSKQNIDETSILDNVDNIIEESIPVVSARKRGRPRKGQGPASAKTPSQEASNLKMDEGSHSDSNDNALEEGKPVITPR
ncbi:hypothetical protein EON64_14470, partial [archaeon]